MLARVVGWMNYPRPLALGASRALANMKLGQCASKYAMVGYADQLLCYASKEEAALAEVAPTVRTKIGHNLKFVRTMISTSAALVSSALPQGSFRHTVGLR